MHHSLQTNYVLWLNPLVPGLNAWCDLKETLSAVLMATVDVDYKFITTDVGSMGRFSDGNIFSSSVLAKNLNK
jgi:hypothetical protein